MIWITITALFGIVLFILDGVIYEGIQSGFFSEAQKWLLRNLFGKSV